ncbi:DUF6087 family protein [Streptomyces celluloflavus]|uniref:DUF6087 family protein n=1 Tax=Streptomyces celluloflavus TaxID=58344 RepID=UPI0036660C47
MDDEEPLADYMARRDSRIGRLRAVHACGPQRGEHVDPEQPRLIQRWNGSAWEVFTMAANLSEARKLLRPADTESPAQEPAQPAQPPLAPGRGRHRKQR